MFSFAIIILLVVIYGTCISAQIDDSSSKFYQIPGRGVPIAPNIGSVNVNELKDCIHALLNNQIKLGSWNADAKLCNFYQTTPMQEARLIIPDALGNANVDQLVGYVFGGNVIRSLNPADLDITPTSKKEFLTGCSAVTQFPADAFIKIPFLMCMEFIDDPKSLVLLSKT